MRFETDACTTKACPDGTIVQLDQACPTPSAGDAAEVVAPQPATQLCPGGKRILQTQTCQTKECDNGNIVNVAEACPTTGCISCKFFPLTTDSAPYWGALLAFVAVVAGGGAGAKKLYRSRLIKRTRGLLAVSGSLEAALGAVNERELEPDGPSIGLHAYLGPEDG